MLTKCFHDTVVSVLYMEPCEKPPDECQSLSAILEVFPGLCCRMAAVWEWEELSQPTLLTFTSIAGVQLGLADWSTPCRHVFFTVCQGGKRNDISVQHCLASPPRSSVKTLLNSSRGLKHQLKTKTPRIRGSHEVHFSGQTEAWLAASSSGHFLYWNSV